MKLIHKKSTSEVKWLTIIPMNNLWEIPEGLKLPYHFDINTSLQSLPEWLFLDEENDQLRSEFKKIIDRECFKYCVLIEYQADSLGMPDPKYQDTSRSIQESAFENGLNVFLAFWLVNSSILNFREVAHIEKWKTNWIIRQISKYSAIQELQNYGDNDYALVDFAKAALDFLAAWREQEI